MYIQAWKLQCHYCDWVW